MIKIVKKIALIGVITSVVGSLTYYGYNTNNSKENVVFAETWSISEISKEELHDKMLNSIDYFKSVQGTYLHINTLAHINQEVSYKIKSGDKDLSYEKVVSTDRDEENIFDGNTVQEYDNKNKTLKESIGNKQNVNKDNFKASKRYTKLEDGKKAYTTRPDPYYLKNSKDSIFSQFIALSYLEDYSKWDITSTEEYLGYDAVTVEGTFNDYYSKKFNANNFKLIISKDTGILFKLEINTPSGEIVQLIETKEIKINSSIDDSSFKKDKNEYKKVK